MTSVTRRLAWGQTVLRRLWWGARDAGLPTAVGGLARLALLRLQRPTHAELITAQSNLRIGFDYPAQLMPLLVVFREPVDPELRMLPKLLGPSSVAVDIGASIGTWTLCAAKTGARVHACEPDRQNFSTLQRNVETNGFGSTVVLHNCAFAAENGWSRMVPQARRYLISLRNDGGADPTNGMAVQSFDTFADRLGLTRIDVLKINTAGSEADVLRGSRDLFSQQRVGVAIVLDGPEVRPLFAELGRHSYRFGFYDARAGRFVPVAAVSELDRARPSPMNRHVILMHSSVPLEAVPA